MQEAWKLTFILQVWLDLCRCSQEWGDLGNPLGPIAFERWETSEVAGGSLAFFLMLRLCGEQDYFYVYYQDHVLNS